MKDWSPRDRASCIAVLLATGAVVMAATLINVALPGLMRDLHLGHGSAQWLSTGFLATMTGTMLVTPWLSRRLGERRLYLMALAVFVAASVTGMLAGSFVVVLLARLVQGAVAGVLQPLAMTTLFRLFPADQRGRAMGWYGLGVVLSPAIGPSVGGFLVDLWNWRAIFLLELPFMAVAWGLLRYGLPPDGPTETTPFDWTGFVWLVATVAIGFAGMAGLEGRHYGLAAVGGLLAAGALLAFIRHARRAAAPLTRIEIFRTSTFHAAFWVAVAYGMGIYGSSYLIPLLLQQRMGLSAGQAGLAMMPGGLLLAAVLPVTGRIADRWSGRTPLLAGLLLFTVSSGLLAAVKPDTGLGWVIAWTLLGRLALGLIIPALNANAVRHLPADLMRDGTSAINFARLAGGAFGIALLSLLVDGADGFAHSFELVALLYAVALLPGWRV